MSEQIRNRGSRVADKTIGVLLCALGAGEASAAVSEFGVHNMPEGTVWAAAGSLAIGLGYSFWHHTVPPEPAEPEPVAAIPLEHYWSSELGWVPMEPYDSEGIHWGSSMPELEQ